MHNHKQLIFISDFFSNQVAGGAELNDEEVINELERRKYEVVKINSHMVRKEDILNKKIIVSNFINLAPAVKEYISKNNTYAIYEHDHKYLINRNPAKYKNFLAPTEKIVNKTFYKNSKVIFCQSKFHENILSSNLNADNTYNVSGNFWSEKIFENLLTYSKKNKNDFVSIMNSNNWHKNTLGSIEYCEKNNIKYELIGNMPYENFLKKVSDNKTFIFIPKTPETLSRIIVECKMMNMKVITNKLVGATYENWFELSGEALINKMYSNKKTILNTIEKKLDMRG